MLDSLPAEIIEQILGYLPTASSITNVAFTNRKLHTIVSADNYGIFRNFVQKAFPSIDTPPLWRQMACALTSRSRAWDRRSFIARECHPPESENMYLGRNTYQKFGFIPVIDSYEQWSGTDQKQVLAFAAGGRLRLRIIEKGLTEWKSLRLPDDHLQQNDIVNLQLLRPHQHQNLHGETIIFRRANREILKFESGVGKDNFTEISRYMLEGAYADCMDVNMSRDPLLAVVNTKSLYLYSAGSINGMQYPSTKFTFAQDFHYKHRKRCIKFLDDTTVATGVQFLEGRERAPIMIYKVSPASVVTALFQPSTVVDLENPLRGRHCANVIASLDSTASLAGRDGQVFLSGWTDGIVRLHDLRTPLEAVEQYTDQVDDGQILSLSVIGHERFFAGSHQNGCVKFFDLRMSGARTYSYLNVVPQISPKEPKGPKEPKEPKEATHTQSNPSQQRGINIFLALTVQRNHLWAPLPRQQGNTSLPRYRGSVYSLSSPSSSSPTVFAGIENHVIQFDFVNTDDICRKHNGLCDPALGLSTLTVKPEIDHVLSLSCYERPRESHIATDPVLLRKQVDWHEVVRGIDDPQYGPAEDGWDHRWRMTRSWKDQDRTRRQRWRNGYTA